MSPFEILKIIYEKKAHDREEVIADYDPFVVNKGMSFNRDTVFFANACNQYYSLGKDMQFDFMYNIVPKGKRYGEWVKNTINNIDVEIVAQYFNINKSVAERYVTLLSEDQINIIKTKMVKGGRHGR